MNDSERETDYYINLAKLVPIISISKHASLILYNIINFLTFKVLSMSTCVRSHKVPPMSLNLPQRKTVGCNNPFGLNLQQGSAVTLGDLVALTTAKTVGTLGRTKSKMSLGAQSFNPRSCLLFIHDVLLILYKLPACLSVYK